MRFILVFSAVTLLSYVMFAKRIAPATVEPVVRNDVRYLAPNNDGRRGYIEAWDVQSNKKLWDLTVFTNAINPTMEEDVQWVFINKLSIRDDTLLVTSEQGKIYQVDLNTKTVKQSDPASSQAPSTTASPNDTPEEIKRVVGNGVLTKDYELSFRLKPSYLRGDFNGDGKVDVAVLVKQRPSGKDGIAIVHGATDKITILGAGTAIGNGGDDFGWMDSWHINSKGNPNNRTNTPKLHGDALLVSKSEVGSALIYWNGKRYVWWQQGD